MTTLSLESVICQVCQQLLVKPVKFPCTHAVCMECLEQIVEKSNLTCPVCRKRLSVFLRKTKNLISLVEEKLWSQIQQQFPNELQRRMSGFDDGVYHEIVQPMHQIATPGEVRAEFERLANEEEQRRRELDEDERSKSMKVIEELERENREKVEQEERRKEQMLRDEELARMLQRQEEDELAMTRTLRAKRKSTTRTSSVGPIDVFCVKASSPFTQQTPLPTRAVKSAQKRKSSAQGPLDKFFLTEKRQCNPTPCSSADSIESEMNYFKPINWVSRTPPKSDAASTPIVVKAITPTSTSGTNGLSSRRLFSTSTGDDTSSDTEMTSVDPPSTSTATRISAIGDTYSSTNHTSSTTQLITDNHPTTHRLSNEFNRPSYPASSPSQFHNLPLEFTSPSHWSRRASLTKLFTDDTDSENNNTSVSSLDIPDDAGNTLPNVNKRSDNHSIDRSHKASFKGRPVRSEHSSGESERVNREVADDAANGRSTKRCNVTSVDNIESLSQPREEIFSNVNTINSSVEDIFTDVNTQTANEEEVTAARNKREIEHFFSEFKKISLSNDGKEEVCFSQVLNVASLPLVRRRRCYVESDEDTDVEDMFRSPRKPAIVK